MRIRPALILTVVAALVSSPAFATEHEGWVYNGMTGSGSISQGDFSDNSISSNSSFGYRWGKVGVEAGLGYFGKFKDQVLVVGTPVDVDRKVTGWTTGVNYNVDIDDKWSVQGRVGLFHWNSDGHVQAGAVPIAFDDSGSDYYAGTSVDYKWSKRSSIGLGYAYFKVADASINLWGMHSEFRF